MPTGFFAKTMREVRKLSEQASTSLQRPGEHDTRRLRFSDFEEAVSQFGEDAVFRALIGDRPEIRRSGDSPLHFNDNQDTQRFNAIDLDASEIREQLSSSDPIIREEFFNQFRGGFEASTLGELREVSSVFSGGDSDLSNAEAFALARGALRGEQQQIADQQQTAIAKSTQVERAREAPRQSSDFQDIEATATGLLQPANLSRERLLLGGEFFKGDGLV